MKLFTIFKKIITPLFNGKGEENGPEEVLGHMQSEQECDVLFIRNFRHQGGKFLYCEHRDDISAYLRDIVNDGKYATFWCVDPQLQTHLKSLGVSFQDVPNGASINFMRCEYLIARDGSIMLSSDQMGGRRLLELSNAFVIVAVRDQIVSSIDQALQKIKTFKENCIPTNITTIKGYDPSSFQYPSQQKNIYLLLSEYEEA